MDRNQGAQAARNVINLNDKDDYAAHLSGSSYELTNTVLDVMTANPRFSAPANDEAELASPQELAPIRADCRQAKLLCMWIDILAEAESA